MASPLDGAILDAINQETSMKSNEGSIDRAVRVTAGVGLCAAALVGALGPWAWIGVVPLATGLLGFCPLYSLFGFDTCPLDRR
jgi:hypothetical protein